MTEFLDPVLYHSRILKKSFTVRRKSVLCIFTKERSATKFNRYTEEFYNPKVPKVEDTIEGSSNELYAQNMEYRHHYDEIMKHFGECRLKLGYWRYP